MTSVPDLPISPALPASPASGTRPQGNAPDGHFDKMVEHETAAPKTEERAPGRADAASAASTISATGVSADPLALIQPGQLPIGVTVAESRWPVDLALELPAAVQVIENPLDQTARDDATGAPVAISTPGPVAVVLPVPVSGDALSAQAEATPSATASLPPRMPSLPLQATGQTELPAHDAENTQMGKLLQTAAPKRPADSGTAQLATPDTASSPEEAPSTDGTPKLLPESGARTTPPSQAEQQTAAAAARAFPQRAEPVRAGDPHSTGHDVEHHSRAEHVVITPAFSAAPAVTSSHAPIASAAQPVPLDALALEIASQASAGHSRFEIRLDPPELGRIDVRLDVDRDGNVSSRLVIERAETYDLLRRDQSTLERALQQAGLKTSENALQFSLRDQGLAHRHNDEAPGRAISAFVHENDGPAAEAVQGYVRLFARSGGVDIRV